MVRRMRRALRYKLFFPPIFFENTCAPLFYVPRVAVGLAVL